jgi:hypothetical protein
VFADAVREERCHVSSRSLRPRRQKTAPRKERDDIAAELRVILQSQIEAEEAERARPLTDAHYAFAVRLVLWLVIDAGILFVLCQALRAPVLVVAADQAPIGSGWTGPVNVAISIGLAAWTVVAAADLILTAQRLLAIAKVGRHDSVAA